MRLVFTADGQKWRARLAASCTEIVRSLAWHVSCLRVLLVGAGNARHRRANRCRANISRANLSLLRYPLLNWRLYAARGSGYALHGRDATPHRSLPRIECATLHSPRSVAARPFLFAQKFQYVLVDLLRLFLLHPMAAIGDTPDFQILNPSLKPGCEFDAERDIVFTPY